MDVHAGTHVDAPLHFLDTGKTVGDVGLAPFVGRSFVAHIPNIAAIDANALEDAAIPPGVDRLLLRTANSDRRSIYDMPFRDDYVALTLSGAEWIATRGLLLVGIDYLSVQRFGDSGATHRILLEADVCILEGIDLATVAKGHYYLVCLPLALTGAEAAPARAVLFPEE